MHRSTTRICAVLTLALLGAPVAMHVVLHDLDDHHHEVAGGDVTEHDAHGDHEHPVVGSSTPQTPALEQAALSIASLADADAGSWTRAATAKRNAVSLGALRTDTDVGLQPLLSTFLI